MEALLELAGRVAELEREIARINGMDRMMTAEYIEGWEKAAKFCGLSSVTLRRRVANGEVQACSRSFSESAGRTLAHPVFRVSDLRAWREGRCS